MRSCMRSRSSSTRLRSARSVRPSASPEYNTQRATCTACHGSPVATCNDAPQHVPATHDRRPERARVAVSLSPVGCALMVAMATAMAVQIQLGLQQAIRMRALTKERAPTGSLINSHALFSGSYTHTLRLCLSASIFIWSAPRNLSLRLLPVRRPLSVQALTLALFSALLCAPLDPIRLDSIGCKCSTARTVSTVLRWCGGLSVLMIRSAAADSQPAGEGSDHRRRGARTGLPLNPLCTHCLLP